MDSSITSIIIPDWTCNDIDYTMFDFSRFTLVESIEIGDDCFGSVETFQIDGLNRLQTIKIGNDCFGSVETFQIDGLNRLQTIKIGNDCFGSVETIHIDGLNRLQTIKIGNNSFTHKRNGSGDDSLKSFHILNCESLESIQIDADSFSDFGGDFELKNLPQLQSIQIGSVLGVSNNFYHSSFVIRGIELILNIVMIRSSKSTIH